MKRVLVIAPHPDDEILGCGGTLLRLSAEGAELHWLLATTIDGVPGFGPERVAEREGEIAEIERRLGFASLTRLGLPTMDLDRLPLGEVIGGMSEALRRIEPDTVLVPHPGDSHSDHRVVFAAAQACTKQFRSPWLRRLLAYETLSETDSAPPVANPPFQPVLFVDIASTLEAKIEAMTVYKSECGAFPFPRSPEAIRALAMVRGAAAGMGAAEAFAVLREIW